MVVSWKPRRTVGGVIRKMVVARIGILESTT